MDQGPMTVRGRIVGHPWRVDFAIQIEEQVVYYLGGGVDEWAFLGGVNPPT